MTNAIDSDRAGKTPRPAISLIRWSSFLSTSGWAQKIFDGEVML